MRAGGREPGGGNGLRQLRGGAGPWARRLMGLVVLVVAVYLVNRLVVEVGWDEVGARLGEARPSWVGVGALCIVLQLALWSVRQWLSVRRVIEAPPGWAVFPSLVATVAANFLIPFARLVGGLLRARYLSGASRPRVRKRVYYAAVLYDQTAHFAVMGGFTLVGLVVGALLLDRPGLAVGIAVALVLTVVGAATAGIAWVRRAADGNPSVVAGVIRSLKDRAVSRRGFVGRFFASSETAARIYLRLVGSASLWRATLVCGIGVFAALAAAQWAVFHALGAAVDPLLVVTALSLGLAAGVLLGTPGGLGTTEAAMIALYGGFGIDRVDAVSAVLLFRGLQLAVVLALGLPSMLALELHGAAGPEQGAETLPDRGGPR